MSWIAVGVAAAAAVVGGTATYYNNQQVAKKQDSQLAAQLRGDAQKQQEADQATNSLIAKTATSNPNAERGSALTQYINTIQQNKGNALSPLHQVGATSDAYKASGANAALGISDYGTDRAGLMSAIDAPSLQRQDEAANDVRFNSTINEIKRRSAGDDYLAQMRLKAIQPNAWLTGLSGVSSGVSKGAASQAGGGSYGYDYPSGGSTINNGGYTTNLPF